MGEILSLAAEEVWTCNGRNRGAVGAEQAWALSWGGTAGERLCSNASDFLSPPRLSL